MMKPLPSVHELCGLFSVDAETGRLFWRSRPPSAFTSLRAAASWNGRYAGKEAGYRRHGYVVVSINGEDYRAHRIVWAMANGVCPTMDIDHINHDRSDNRASNLRHVPRAENTRNMSLGRRNTSGTVGVSFNKANQKWRAEISAENRLIGHYDTKEQAIAARKKAEVKRGFHPNHGSALRAFIGAQNSAGTEE